MTTTNEKLIREDLRSRLTPEQYRITQQKGTEPAFSGEYVDSRRWHVLLRRVFEPVVSFRHEVRLRFWMAEFLATAGGRQSAHASGREPRDAPRGSSVRQLRCTSRSCFPRWTAAKRESILHQLHVIGFRGG